MLKVSCGRIGAAIETTRGEDVKPKDAFIRGTVMLLAISGSGAFADPPGKEDWEPRKERMGYEREQRKRDREWEREERKYTQQISDFGFQLPIISKFSVSNERNFGACESSSWKNFLQAFL